MTENNEPIAQAPEAAHTPAPAAPRKRRPVLFAGAAAIALAAGIGGEFRMGDVVTAMRVGKDTPLNPVLDRTARMLAPFWLLVASRKFSRLQSNLSPLM